MLGNRAKQISFLSRKKRFVCANCGFEGVVPVKGAGWLMWLVIVAIAWNAWLFQRAGMELEALGACVVALAAAWGAIKLPRWIHCPACGWKHPVDKSEKDAG